MTARHVSQNYRHYEKLASPGEAIPIGSSTLKWYDLATAGTPVDPDVRALSRRFLDKASAHADWPLDEDVGFVILHRCGAEFYFLIVCSWRGNNELWETVYFKPDAATAGFALFPQGTHKGTFCVWEAGIVAHEMKAWTKYLTSPRAAADLTAYLADCIEGSVG